MTDELDDLINGTFKPKTPTDTRKAYTQDELEGFLRQAGWPEDKIPTMGAIGMAESARTKDGRALAGSFNPGVGKGGKPTKEKSYGLWQINMIDPERQRKYDRNRLLADPVYNASVALEIYNQGHRSGDGLNHWGAYSDGNYKKFARRAPAPNFSELDSLIDQPDYSAQIQQAKQRATDPVSLLQNEIENLDTQFQSAASQMERNILIRRRRSPPCRNRSTRSTLSSSPFSTRRRRAERFWSRREMISNRPATFPV
jgi:hypothetical protein